MTFQPRSVMLALAVGSMLVAALPATAGSLLDVHSRERTQGVLDQVEGVLRARPVTLDLVALSEALQPEVALEFTFFSDLTRTALTERVEVTGPESFVWIGRFENQPMSSAVVAVSDGVVAGGFSVDERRLQLETVRSGQQVLFEVDLGRFPTDSGDGVVPEGPNQHRPKAMRTMALGDASIIDLLVVYTKKAKKAAGGKRALKALVRLGIAETNLALEDSEVSARFELAKLKKVPYKEPGETGKTLEQLRTSGDGQLDKAHKLRDKYRADIVLLVLGPTDPNSCGRAFLSPLAPRPEEAAFAVVRWDCISPNFSFGHELGHVLGLEHSRRSNTGAPPHRPYGFGYYEPGGLFRTMMATYQSGAGPRVLHFSNPDVMEDGAPTGVGHPAPDSADAARAINETDASVAGYRE